MDRLKQGTRAEHLALEARVPLMQADLTLAQYGRVVQAFASVVVPLERRAATLPFPDVLAYHSRCHSPALQADLAALGLVASERNLPDTLVTSLPGAYGTLYVLEGSTLGGQLISRHLQKHLNLHAGNGAAYFSGYGPDTGPRWRAFAAFMNDAGRHAPPAWIDEVVHEARTTFETIAAAVAPLETV